MPFLRWNETDFLACFCVEPEVAEYETAHMYRVLRNSLELSVTVWQLESVVRLTLQREGAESPLLDFAAYVRGPARYINDKRGEYLEFSDCIVAPSRFWYQEAGNVFNHERFPHSVTIHLTVNPDTSIRFVNNSSIT